MATTVTKERIWLHKDELLDSITIFTDGKLRYYSHTFQILGKRGHWHPIIRWDNHNQNPHVDKFDENGNFLEQIPSSEKPFREIVKMVTIFRRNLLTMDLRQL